MSRVPSWLTCLSWVLIVMAAVNPGVPSFDPGGPGDSAAWSEASSVRAITSAGAGERLLKGDVDCSDHVDAVDGLKVQRFVSGLPVSQPLGCPEMGLPQNDPWDDVNCSGSTDVVDALVILRAVADLESSLPTGCLAVCLTAPTHGIAYGPFRDGQDPNAGRLPAPDEIREDVTQLASVTDAIRTYGASGVFANITEEASDLGLAVNQGVNINDDGAQNELEIASALDLAERGLVRSLIVGNETIVSGMLSEEELADNIAQVKQRVPAGVLVTTAEPWSVWQQHPALIQAVDYVLVHIYGFWEQKPVADAARYVRDVYESARRDTVKPVVIGETGWPSGGTPEQLENHPPDVVPSEENQATFLKEFTARANADCVSYYIFSAYDEEWKWTEGTGGSPLPGDRTLAGRYPGSSWGIARSDGTLKPALADVFPEWLPPASRLRRTIFDERGLFALYDMGVDSSQGRHDWVTSTADGMRMAYPSGQAWGAVFITVGPPTDPPRPWKDFSSFQALSVELRGEAGGESLEIGIKDRSDPDDGSETKVLISDIPREWTTYQFPIKSFVTANLERLYVVAEFVFGGAVGETVYFRNVEYVP